MLKRDGVTIIEVLTSMAVATIGVFGVMVIIPFGVKQSQSALDADAANALGRNAVEEMQIRGLLSVEDNDDFSRLLVDTGGLFPIPCNTSAFATPAAPGLFHFDPIGFASALTGLTITDATNGDIVIVSTTASRGVAIDLNGDGIFTGPNEPASSPMTLVESRLLCQSRDDQVYSEDDEGIETAPPQPLFDVNGINDVKRQALGRISWSTFFVPVKNPNLASAPSNRFQSYTLAYNDRYISTVGPQPVVSNRDISAVPGSTFDYYQVDNSSARGFETSVSQILLTGPVDTEELSRGDWVMLVNRIPAPDVAGGILNTSVTPTVAADIGYRQQVMFARVTRIANNPATGVGNITIDGGAFDFVSPSIAGHVAPNSSETFMVHLKNVVNVYERSVTAEF